MGKLTKSTPKPLLTFGHSSVLIRLINQISLYSKNISVVTGFQHDKIVSEVSKHSNFPINFIHNKEYKKDINILSVFLALDENPSEDDFIIFEGDCVFDNNSIKEIFSNKWKSLSCWYSIGKFNEKQIGGIIFSKNQAVLDLGVVKEFDIKFKEYNKLVGVLKIGPKECNLYKELIIKYIKKSINQYYLIPWIENLKKLPCYEVDLSPYVVGAFNNIEDYDECIKLFKKNNFI